MQKRLKAGLVLFLILALGLTLLVGCTRRTSRTTTTTEAKPVAGGDLVIGYEQEPSILNSIIEGGDMQATKDVVGNLLWGLLVVDNEFKYQPRLAEKVPTVENGLVTEDPFTVTYNIKEDAEWSDGTPVTSADVKFTWETIMDSKWKILSRTGYDKITEVQTPDDKTVKLIFKEPYAPFKDLFSLSYMVFPKHALEGKDFNTVLNRSIPVSSGPFVFKEWASGDHITLEKNDNFWGDEVFLDSIIFKFIPDTNTELAQFRTGEVDVINPAPDVSLIEQMRAMEGKKVSADPGTIWEHLGFNVSKAPLNNVKVRQAIAYAIDRKAITDQVMKGQVRPLQSVLIEAQDPFYTPAWSKYDHDVDKAKEILEGDGWVLGSDGIYAKGGTRLSFPISSTAGNKAREKLELVMQANLKEAGIELVIKNTDADTLFGSWLVEGNYSAGEWAWVASPDPTITTLFAKDQIPPGGQNYYRYSNDEVSKALHDSDVALEEGERADLLKRGQRLMANDLPLIPLYQRLQILGWDEKVNGSKNNATLEGPFWNIGEWWISK